MNTKEKIIANGMILMTALFWGSSYAVRKIGLAYVGPFFFNGLRFSVAFLFVVSAYLIQSRIINKGVQDESKNLKPLSFQIRGGVFAGITYGVGSAIQQWALLYTVAGKVGFINSLYTIMVPLISWLILKRVVKRQVWMGAVFAFTGLALISFEGGLGVSSADSALVISAFIFSVQILIVGYFSKHSEPLILVSAQMFTGASISMILAILFEQGNTLEGATAALLPIIYAGVFSLGVGNVLQSYAQKKTSSSVTAIILSFESVFGAIFGILLLQERMNLLQWAGCLLIFSAVLISQMDIKKRFWFKKGNETDRGLH